MMRDDDVARATPSWSMARALAPIPAVVLAVWSVCLLAATSDSNTFKWLFWSPHGGAALLLIPCANLLAAGLAVSAVARSPREHRPKALASLAVMVVLLVALSRPCATVLQQHLSPPLKGDVAAYQLVLFLPLSWLLPR